MGIILALEIERKRLLPPAPDHQHIPGRADYFCTRNACIFIHLNQVISNYSKHLKMYKLLTDDHLEYADRSYVDESFGHSI